MCEKLLPFAVSNGYTYHEHKDKGEKEKLFWKGIY